MRPVDLIPAEQRQGAHAPMRTGPIPYILVGGLAAVLVAVALLILTGNQISECEGELAGLKAQNAVAKERAQALVAYTQFQTLHEQRLLTIASLADSRFDWERVMRELSLILPHNVWLVGLTATAAPDVSVQGGGGGASNMRGSIPGPALELSGCAHGQKAVAGFVTALKDIDGVTRVGVQSSELPDEGKGGGGEGGGSDSSGDECRTRKFIAKFEIVVAFDAAPVVEPEGEEAAPPVATGTVETTSSESSEGE